MARVQFTIISFFLLMLNVAEAQVEVKEISGKKACCLNGRCPEPNAPFLRVTERPEQQKKAWRYPSKEDYRYKFLTVTGDFNGDGKIDEAFYGLHYEKNAAYNKCRFRVYAKLVVLPRMTLFGFNEGVIGKQGILPLMPGIHISRCPSNLGMGHCPGYPEETMHLKNMAIGIYDFVDSAAVHYWNVEKKQFVNWFGNK